MKKTDPIPRHLKAGSREMYRRLLADFHIDDAAGKALLLAACEARQRAEEARLAMAKSGACVPDRFGQLKPSPWTAIERDSRGQMIAALRALRLAPGDEQ